MKVRMIFGTFIPQAEDKPDRELPVGSEHDLPDEIAAALIEQGRAESLEPAKPKKA